MHDDVRLGLRQLLERMDAAASPVFLFSIQTLHGGSGSWAMGRVNPAMAAAISSPRGPSRENRTAPRQA